ncbi:DUF1566 domain-containing protein [bacterium]|nr:DUF1566 domain-containing protein [bacterium]
MTFKKFNLLFVLVLSVFFIFSCSSNDDEKEEMTDTASENEDHDDLDISDIDISENDDHNTDTGNDSDDIVISDNDSSENNDSDNIDISDLDISENNNDPDPTDDPDTTGDDDSDTDSTDESDEDNDITIPDIPVVFGNICTGQTKCYSETTEITCPDEGEAFFGQDAQYAKAGKCIQQKFTVKGTGDEKIVFDENLKLEWQQKIPEGSFDWQSAANYCGQEYAGSYGWRLPTPKELLSIVDNGRYDPAVNTDLFPGTNDEWFWTSADFASTAEADQNKAWFVRFDKGFLSHKSKTESEKMHVRCVRGTPLPDGEFGTEKIGEDEVVKDSVTGLMWQKTYKDSVKKFADALSTCEDLDYAGFTDWRLPNKNELASIANYAKYRPASDFPGMPNWTFRTSTSDAKKSPTTNDWKNAWYVTFYDGIVNFEGKSTSDSVRCVRRGE